MKKKPVSPENTEVEHEGYNGWTTVQPARH